MTDQPYVIDDDGLTQLSPSVSGNDASREVALVNVGDKKREQVSLLGLLGVLGVVYGDIGTSPLYAFQATVGIMASGRSQPLPQDIMGLESLVFWALMFVVTLKYVTLVMRADHNGEGGIIALMSLAQRVCKSPQLRLLLGIIGIAGACLFFGDGVITPAVSVLSAIEGIEVSLPSAADFILPVAILILIALFAVQSFGTGKIGRFFGPVMLVWFTSIALLGLTSIVKTPQILESLSPYYAALFVLRHGWLAFLSLGSVVLAVTGAEALYADMGHFGRKPIQYAWLLIVLPALMLNYLGQGALLIRHPEALQNPFFHLAPSWAQIPLLLLATSATVIASQAGISGGFSLCRQLIQLGSLPRMRIMHTNPNEEAQIYLPVFNWVLAIGAILLVLSFKSSSALAAAYGIAVTGTFLCTAALATVVFHRVFKWRLSVTLVVFGFFFISDGMFFTANFLKVPDGGWVPLAIGLTATVLITTWERGRRFVRARQQADSLPVATFVARLPQSHTLRVPGTGIFLTGNPEIVPICLLHNLKHNKVLHDHVLFVTVQNLNQPEAEPGRRTIVETLAPDIFRIIIHYGFMETPNLPKALEELNGSGVPFDAILASYFVSRELVVRSNFPKFSLWRMWLFLLMMRNSVPSTEFFQIPPDRVVELGVRIAI